MRRRRVLLLVAVVTGLSACTALAGLKPLSFDDPTDSGVDRIVPDATTEATLDVDAGADGGTDATPSGSGSCASTAPLFVEDFSAFDAGGWSVTTSGSCSASNRAFPAGPQGLCAEMSCTAKASEAFTILQTTQVLPENVHTEAELLVSLDPAAPEHAFAQAVGWVTDVTALRFFSGPTGVTVKLNNGPTLASWALKAPGFYLLEVQLTRLNDADGGIATGRARVAFDGEAKLFDVPITVSGAGQRAPFLQIGPYFPQSPGASATDRYDSIKLWSCP